ncbi:hypothetical protein [Nocardia wallacei]|uniref:hypothetical protein n=1 Tax=Nocardia wallacei TaxID=480035 RepID=UPI002458E991|nr:hypothetical protein [Nocardia wallacei]
MAAGVGFDQTIRQLAQRFFFTGGLVFRGGTDTHTKLLGIAAKYARFARHRPYVMNPDIPKRDNSFRAIRIHALRSFFRIRSQDTEN